VFYLEEKNVDDVDRVITILVAAIDGKQWGGNPQLFMNFLSPLVKHASFEAEHEWRLLMATRQLKQIDVRFRAGRSHLIPFVEIPLEEQSIEQIMVGPGPNMDLDVLSLEKLVEARELPVKITRSKLPYRNW
jgi:hypothetical protein